MTPAPRRLRSSALCCALVVAALPVSAFAAAGLTVRFYPERELRLHPANEQRGLATLLLQNAAVVNTGDQPVALDSVTLELWAGEALAQSHPIAGPALAKVAERSGRLGSSGMIEMFGFQFRPATLLAGAQVAGATTLAPGEALLVGHRAFLLQSAAIDALRLVARGRDPDGSEVAATGVIPISQAPAGVAYGFPLQGSWLVGAGASLQSHHRWVVPEEFALDIGRVGEGGRTYRGDGTKNADYYAWDAPVRAAADGKVVAVLDKFPDTEEFLRQAGEPLEAYNQRIQGQQMALFAQGLEAIGGNVVVLEHGGGEFSHYAHLRRGSVVVAVGDLLKRGQPLARLGNSGNSTEPHLHFQVADGPDPLGSVGRPVTFDDVEILWADFPRALQTGDHVEAK